MNHGLSSNQDSAWLCNFAFVKVNGKVWLTGGYDNTYRWQTVTSFLLPDFTWIRGPDLPEKKTHHRMVTIEDTKVVIFGGKYPDVWIYDDESKTFDKKNPFYIGRHLSAYKITDFKELGKEVILVCKIGGSMYIYDWKIDFWYALPYSWKAPDHMYYHATFFEVNKRLFMMGGSTYWHGSPPWSNRVYERVNGEWVRSCDIKREGHVSYIGETQLNVPNDNVLTLDSDRTIPMENKCLRVKFQQNVTISLLRLTFPAEICWNVSGVFQSAGSCVNVSVSNGISEGKMGSYCDEPINYIQISPGEILNIRITSNETSTMKICKEECCHKDGIEDFWLQWGEWSDANTCPRNSYIGENVKLRRRKCKSNCECNEQGVTIYGNTNKGKVFFAIYMS